MVPLEYGQEVWQERLELELLDKSFKPFTYFNNMLPIFAAAIVGGIGNPFGAFLGGYVIAFSEIFITYAYKKFFMYILPESMEPETLVQSLI